MLEDFIRSVFNAPPSQRRVREDLSAMVALSHTWRAKVIPWEDENEMELLSLNHEFQWVKQSPGRVARGVFKSIYHEPMVAYAFKSYQKKGHYAISYAATSAHEFVYRTQKERTEFFIDGEHVGHLTPQWIMYSHRGRMLGRRNRYSATYYSVVIWDEEVAHIRNPGRIDRVNARVFEILGKMGEKERLLLMAMTFLTMIDAAHCRDA